MKNDVYGISVTHVIVLIHIWRSFGCCTLIWCSSGGFFDMKNNPRSSLSCFRTINLCNDITPALLLGVKKLYFWDVSCKKNIQSVSTTRMTFCTLNRVLVISVPTPSNLKIEDKKHSQPFLNEKCMYKPKRRVSSLQFSIRADDVRFLKFILDIHDSWLSIDSFEYFQVTILFLLFGDASIDVEENWFDGFACIL